MSIQSMDESKPAIVVDQDSDVRVDSLRAPPRFRRRYVHLDMKGAPPKLDYLKIVIPLFKRWGATGLLLEWEDVSD